MKQLLLVLLAVCMLTGCDKGETPEVTYTVTFNADGGTPTPQSQTVKAGEKATAPANPSKTGYAFLFWHLNGVSTAYNFQTPVNSNIALQAKWESEATVEYWQVSWMLDGGTWPSSGDNHATQVVKGGTLAEPAAPTKTGKAFDGWYKEAALTNKINFPYDVSAVTSNLTLYAKWVDPAAEYWQITWELNGGAWPSTGDNHAAQVVKGTTLAEPVAPSKAGHTFDGWYKEAAFTNKVVFPYAATANFKLYAKWVTGDPSNRGEGLYISNSVTPINISAVSGDNIVRKALNYIYYQPTANNYILILENDIQMAPLEYDSWITLSKKGALLTIIGKGKNISITGPDNSCVLGTSEGTLILEKNITLKGKCKGIHIGGENSTTIMREGSSVQVCGFKSSVTVTDKGNFIMEGGTITGNVSPDQDGGGVLAQLDGVFTMKGGSISGNYAGNGGGVHVSNAFFTMEGGWIGDNQALKKGDSALGITITSGSGYGGGLSVNSGRVIKKGGTIYGSNSATTPNKAKTNGDCYYFFRGRLVLTTVSGEWEISPTNEGSNQTL